MVEALLVSYQLERYELASHVVEAATDLSEAALAQDLVDFVAISEVVRHYNLIVAPLVIVPVVHSVGTGTSLLRLEAEEVDLGVVEDLALLIVAEERSEQTESCGGGYRQFESFIDLTQVR